MLRNQMTRMAQYLRYSAMIAVKFGNASLTPESRLMPYQYYRFIELYKQYGGDMKWVDDLLKSTGYTADMLKQYYDQVYGAGGYESVDAGGSSSVDDYVAELAEVARIVAGIQGLSPEGYAAAPQDSRDLDSIFYGAIEQYVQMGVPRESIEANPDIQKVDMARSKRVFEEYSRNHP